MCCSVGHIVLILYGKRTSFLKKFQLTKELPKVYKNFENLLKNMRSVSEIFNIHERILNKVRNPSIISYLTNKKY